MKLLLENLPPSLNDQRDAMERCLRAMAGQQIAAARRLRKTLWTVWPRPPLTLIPITPERLAEKQRAGDHFFQTVFNEGVQLAAEGGLE